MPIKTVLDGHIQNMIILSVKSFEDFGAYNKEGKTGSIDLIGENQIENSMEGTETLQGATVPVHDAENPIQNDINLQEGDDDNGRNKENTSTNFSITGQMGFH